MSERVRRRAELFYQQLDALQGLRQEARQDLLAESRKTFQDLLSQLAAYHDPCCSFSPAQAPPPASGDST